MSLRSADLDIFQLRQLPKLPKQAFVSCCLDYCNSLLYDVSYGIMKKPGLTQNTAARLVTGARPCDHIMHVLRQLRSLPVRQRVDYKTACPVQQSVSGLAPAHLADDINLFADSGRRLLRSAADRKCVVPLTHNTTPLATGVSLLPVRGCGTIYRLSCDRTSATDNSNGNRNVLSCGLNCPVANETVDCSTPADRRHQFP